MKRLAFAVGAFLFILAAATSAVEIFALNTVGFTRVALEANTWHLVGISFEQTDGEAVSLADVLGTAGIPEGTKVMAWDTVGMTYRSSSYFEGAWFGDAVSLPPGKGLWIRSPDDHTLNLMGQVPQTETMGLTITEGFQLISSPYPATVDAVNAQTPVDGDQIISFDGTQYRSVSYYQGAWYGDADAQTLQSSRGYWYKSASGESRVIEFPRPYDNP